MATRCKPLLDPGCPAITRIKRRTNRWTGATGSVFRIKRDPAKLLGNAVARSTQTFARFACVRTASGSDPIKTKVA